MIKLSIMSLFAAVSVLTLFCKFGFSAPRFPCCPGSQQVVALMSGYLGPFTFALESHGHAELCTILTEDVEGMKHDLRTMTACSKGGGRRMVDAIDAQLRSSAAADACAYSFGFVRAMFAVAAKATAHLMSTKWDDVTRTFEKQIGVIDDICRELKIGVNKAVEFSDPFRGIFAHDDVSAPDQVVNNPGKQSAYRKEKDGSTATDQN